jgi:hypothetical protein
MWFRVFRQRGEKQKKNIQRHTEHPDRHKFIGTHMLFGDFKSEASVRETVEEGKRKKKTTQG